MRPLNEYERWFMGTQHFLHFRVRFCDENRAVAFLRFLNRNCNAHTLVLDAACLNIAVLDTQRKEFLGIDFSAYIVRASAELCGVEFATQRCRDEVWCSYSHVVVDGGYIMHLLQSFAQEEFAIKGKMKAPVTCEDPVEFGI